jgi:transposase
MKRERVLREENSELSKNLRRTQSQAAEQKRQIEALKAKLVLMQQLLFGRKSEQSDKECGEQQGGKDGPESDKADRAGITRRNRGKQPGAKGNGRKRRARLPAEQIDHDLPEDQKCCPNCEKPFLAFPGSEDSEEIDWQVRLVRRVHKRKRYRKACDCGAIPGIVTAPCPAKLIPKGMFSCGFWTELVLNKYLHGMPLHRIVQKLAMNNLPVSPGTLTGGLKKISDLIQPLYALILERSRTAKHWHMDETRWMVFAELAGKANHRWWLWVVTTGETCAYILDPSRSANVPRNHLGDDAEGIINADRYSAYKALGLALRIAFCWVHVRRDFIRIRDSIAKLSAWAASWVGDINNLFGANSERLRTPSGSKQFQLADQSLRNALERMKQRRESELGGENLHESQNKVLVSLRKHWQGLTIFVDRPEIPMDNNEAERAIRGPVVGRKNYYGSGSIWSGMLSSALFTIIQTLLWNNISPKPFLLEYFETCARNGGEAPQDLGEFLPWNMSEEKKSQWKHKERSP